MIQFISRSHEIREWIFFVWLQSASPWQRQKESFAPINCVEIAMNVNRQSRNDRNEMKWTSLYLNDILRPFRSWQSYDNPYIGHRRIAIDCCAYRMRMLIASPSLPGTVPTSHIRHDELEAALGSMESSEIDSSCKRRSFRFLTRCFLRRSQNHTQLRLSPSVNDSAAVKITHDRKKTW